MPPAAAPAVEDVPPAAAEGEPAAASFDKLLPRRADVDDALDEPNVAEELSGGERAEVDVPEFCESKLSAYRSRKVGTHESHLSGHAGKIALVRSCAIPSCSRCRVASISCALERARDRRQVKTRASHRTDDARAES